MRFHAASMPFGSQIGVPLTILLSLASGACGASLARFADSIPTVARTIADPSSARADDYPRRLEATCVDVPTCAVVRERSRLLGLRRSLPGNLVRPLIASSLRWLERVQDHDEDEDEECPSSGQLAELQGHSSQLRFETLGAVKDTRDAVERTVLTQGALEPFRLAVSTLSGVRSPACRLDGPDAARLAVLRHELEVVPQSDEQVVVVMGARAPTSCFAIPTLGRGPRVVVARGRNVETGPARYISGPRRRGGDLLFEVGSYMGTEGEGGGGGECTVRRIGAEWRIIECVHTWDG